LHAAEQDRPDVAAERAALKAEQPKLRAPRLVFIDETAVTTKMVRHYGRSPRGERLVSGVPHGHWKTLTLVAALRIDGLTAPYVIDGAMDGPSFLAYVEQVLAPTLRKGDIVFMDNLRTHKIAGVREAIEAVDARVRYLPAYSPDLNPIEQAFSRLKAALRKGATRTVDALLKLIGKLIRSFAPQMCANYFRHAGYTK
jgi:transposase